MIPFIVGMFAGAILLVIISCCYVSRAESRKEEQREEAQREAIKAIIENNKKE